MLFSLFRFFLKLNIFVVLYGIFKRLLEKKEKVWKIWEIVTILVENCDNFSGKLLQL